MFLTKQPNGSYIPSYESDYEHSRKIKAGTEVKATKPRNVKFLRKAFALLDLGQDNQDKYDNIELYRKIITIRAGYYTEVIDKKGDTHLIPDSLSFDNMNEEKFEKWFEATLNVIAKDLETAPELVIEQISGFY